MNQTPTENDPLMDMVAKLDPSPGQLSVAATTHKRQLFDQLVEPEVAVAPLVPFQEANPAGGRTSDRRFALPAIAAALVIVVAAFAFTLSRSPSAEAVLVAAAEQTALIDSGRAEIVIDLREPSTPEDGLPDELRFDYVFDGDDYRLDTVVDGAVVVSEITVDNVTYFGAITELSSQVFTWVAETEFPFTGGFFDEILIADTGPESVLPLVELADDFERTETDRGATYRGTISRTDFLAQEELPAGVAIVTIGDDPAADLPETVVFEVEVIDGLVRSIELLVEGDLPTGEYLSATLTTTYFDYGQPQNLQAPAAEDLVTRDDVVGAQRPEVASPDLSSPDSEVVVAVPLDANVPPLWAPGPDPQTESERVIAEVLQRRPELCFDAGQSPSPPQPGEEVRFYADIKADVLACFLAAGEMEALAALQDIPFG